MGNAPHTSTSCPPDVIHVIGVPRPSPFFAPLPCTILNKNRRTKNGGGLGTRLDIVHIVNLLIECLSQLMVVNKPSPVTKKNGQIGPVKPKLAAKKNAKMSVCVCFLCSQVR